MWKKTPPGLKLMINIAVCYSDFIHAFWLWISPALPFVVITLSKRCHHWKLAKRYFFCREEVSSRWLICLMNDAVSLVIQSFVVIFYISVQIFLSQYLTREVR